MRKNSTLQFLDFSLKEGSSNFNQLFNKFTFEKSFEPKKETISKIFAYARSVRAVKTNSGNRILISLN